MNDLKEQLNPFLCGDELTEALTVLPPYREGLTAIPDRLMALLDIYKIFLPGKSTQDIYNRLNLAILKIRRHRRAGILQGDGECGARKNDGCPSLLGDHRR